MVANEVEVSAAVNVTAPQWLPAKIQIEKSFSLPGIAFCAARGGASEVFVGLSDFAIHRVDLSDAMAKVEAKRISEATHQSYVTGIVATGRTIISGAYDGALIWWNADTGEVIRRNDVAHAKWIRGLAITPDQSRVVSVADDMKTKVWDVATGNMLVEWGDYEVKTPHGFPSMLYAVAISPDGKWVATGDRTGRVHVRSLADGVIAKTLETPVMYTWDPRARHHSIGGIRSLAFSRDSSLLAVGGMGKVGNIDHLEGPSRIEVFRWQSAERMHEIEDPKFKGLVESLSFGTNDAWLIAAGGDHSGFVSVYNMQDGKLIAQEKAGEHLHDFVVNDGERTIIAVGHHYGSIIHLE